ncbi:MAG: 16S rRNA (uracil(1498)-N(3))-methyltransferase [Victivallaceae bacterium]|nr:16S rRNA (uracil(1498)-N(3))-methyltransferase [Victivallaceae bacterium]
MNLVLLFETDFTAADTAVLRGRRFEHLRRILRAGLGDRVKAGLLNGRIGAGEVTGLTDESIQLRLELTAPPPAALPLTLVCALPRPHTLKKVIQAAVAFGAKRIYFIAARKVEKSYWSSPALTEPALREQIFLGLEQGGDTVMPEIGFRRAFKVFAEDELPGIVNGTRGLTAHPAAADVCPSRVSEPVTLCVGPEGGFTDYEVELLAQHGCRPVHLGKRPLRTEFAVCALLGRLF